MNSFVNTSPSNIYITYRQAAAVPLHMRDDAGSVSEGEPATNLSVSMAESY